jgi:hypothetical protein
MTQPPGTGSLVDQLNDLRRQVAELSRKAPSVPACRVILSAPVGLTAASDAFAPGVWTVREDPFGWFTSGSPSFITAGLDGYYQLAYHSNVTGQPNNSIAAAKISTSGTSVANSLASDIGIQMSSEGVVLNAFRARVFISAGTKLYWSNFVSASGGTLQATSFAIPTEMTVQFISSR